jgi:anti-anti-sigma factor
MSAIRQPVLPQLDRGAIMGSGITINPSLDISTRTVGGITIAELAGELDIASVPALRVQLRSLLRPGSSRLIVDLSKVSICDARGLAVLVGISSRARLLGGFLRLAAVSPQADRVLHFTGLHRHLLISPLSTQPQPVPPPSATALSKSPQLEISNTPEGCMETRAAAGSRWGWAAAENRSGTGQTAAGVFGAALSGAVKAALAGTGRAGISGTGSGEAPVSWPSAAGAQPGWGAELRARRNAAVRPGRA